MISKEIKKNQNHEIINEIHDFKQKEQKISKKSEAFGPQMRFEFEENLAKFAEDRNCCEILTDIDSDILWIQWKLIIKKKLNIGKKAMYEILVSQNSIVFS